MYTLGHGSICIYDDFVYFYDMISKVSFIQERNKKGDIAVSVAVVE